MLLVFGVILLPFVLALGWFGYQLRPGSEGKKVDVVVIEEGWGSGDIGTVLADEGVINSKLAFQVWATITRAGPFQAGCYTNLRQDIGIRSAMSTLESTQPGTWVKKDKQCLPPAGEDSELLLRPGLTLSQIAAQVAEQLPGRSAEKFLEVAQSGTIRSKYQPAEVASLEGLLFPDTYRVGTNEDESAIIRKLVDRFDEIADSVGLANATRVTPYQTVIVASLIETEAGVAEDQALIAAVIYNRLRDGMPLQIDSTLCYSKGGCPPPPTDADKALDSPYNTYKIPGLPPTPISSVTEASLRAALAPADVPFKFYVIADANGKHAFATTLEEHDRNVADRARQGPAVTDAIRGTTRVAGIIGDPVAHSRSPAIWNAGFREAGVDWVFVAFPVPAGGAAAALDGMRGLGIEALTVTMPHKSDAAQACDRLTPTAKSLDAVNAVLFRDDVLSGDSTDGPGFVRSLLDAEVDPARRRCLVLGAGGAGRAIARALGEHGAEVVVAARREPAAVAAASLAPDGRAITFDGVAHELPDADVVVNATPVGMRGEAPPIDVDALRKHALVADTIYHPLETALLAAARARGLRAVGGLGMLVHQAAISFEWFTGVPAPLAVMEQAAAEEP